MGHQRSAQNLWAQLSLNCANAHLLPGNLWSKSGAIACPKNLTSKFWSAHFLLGQCHGKKHMTFLSPTSQVGRTCTNNFINGAHSSINLGTGACCHLVRCRIDANKSATDTLPIANIPLAITWVRASASMMPELAQNWSKSAAHTGIHTNSCNSPRQKHSKFTFALHIRQVDAWIKTGGSTQDSQLLCT